MGHSFTEVRRCDEDISDEGLVVSKVQQAGANSTAPPSSHEDLMGRVEEIEARAIQDEFKEAFMTITEESRMARGTCCCYTNGCSAGGSCNSKKSDPKYESWSCGR